MKSRVGLVAFVGLLANGCAYRSVSGPVATPTPKPAPPAPWSVTCTDPLAEEPAWLSNGLIGVRIGRDGAPVEVFRADRHEPEGEERLIPGQPLGLRVDLDGKALHPTVGKPYAQRFDFRTLTLTTAYDSGGAHIERVTAVVRDRASMTDQIALGLPMRCNLRISLPEGSDIECAVAFDGNRHVVTADGWSSLVGPGEVVIESTWRYGQARVAAPPPMADIEIEGPIEDQQAVRSFLAYLDMAIPAGGSAPGPLSPHGLSADHYLGHVFWDADVWVFPALALLSPSRAKEIPGYRLRHFEAAKRNYSTWWNERRREGKKQPGAAKYPWQSAISGLETAHDEFREEVHINGAVLWGLTLADRLGLADPEEVERVEEACDLFWRSLMTPRPGRKTFDIKRVFGVDEFRSIDNDLVTNLLAQWTINGRTHVRPPGVPELQLPKKDGSGLFATYEGDTQQTFKQAAAVLSIYPYQFPPAETMGREMMDHYASRIDRRGPAMTEAIHATIWARIGQPETAYGEWKAAWQDFTEELLLFSEHRQRDRAYFVTGAAGCLQTVLYGFLGFRIDYKQVPGAVWTLPLKSGGWLSVKPNLPKAWTRVTVRNLQLLGRSYTLEITHNGVQVKEGES